MNPLGMPNHFQRKVLASAALLLALCACQQPVVAPAPAAPDQPAAGGSTTLRGLYAYMADAASFQDCRSGQRRPVLMTRDHRALERAYLAARTEPGAPLLAIIEGRFEMHAPEPGLAPREHVVVERFIVLRPGETCAADAPSRATLTNTYWRPVELEGRPVEIRPGTREPHLILDMQDSRARGFSGCNSFSGRYEQQGDSLRFGNIAATMMACLPAGDLEQRFFAALKAAAGQRLRGETLELLDAGGKVRARFESRYLR